MGTVSDPTTIIRERAAAWPNVQAGTSCNQTSFKVGKKAFLFIGPGPKGVGFKAMFKLDESMQHARDLTAAEPSRFEVGKTGWVTVRFTADEPVPRSIWEPWLEESFRLSGGIG